ncbi:coiled-coil domain-containing protein 183-like isoform X2 [Clinocottus analis]|uniref:coiled-coil domain-containing protein 183-like isoform X2 n=1 Tax=Clinocottus analis TaxID=304258 RepID=UPI0035C20C53
MKDSGTPTLRQIKTSEKQTEESSAKARDSYDQPTTRPKPTSKPGLPLEKRMRHEKWRWHVLTNEHNRLTFAVNEEEAKLKRLQETLKAKEFQPTSPNDEDSYKQRMRKLENNRDKIKMKIIEATEIQTAYEHIHEHLQQVRGMFVVLEQKQQALAAGQAEVDRATKQFRSAAADSTLSNMVQMEDGTMRMKKEMENELCKLRAEEKELKWQMESLEPPISTGQSRQKQEEIKEEEDIEAHSVSFSDHQCFDSCSASQSDLELVEDMEALREALGYTDVQELVDKVVSQRAVKEQLFTEITEYKDTIKHEAEVLAELELQHARLQFSAKPAMTRVEMEAQLKQKVDDVQRLQVELKQCQDLLDTVERGVNNLYFTMRCVPMEGMPSTPSADSSDRLREVRAHLPTLVQRASEPEPEISDFDQRKALSAAAGGASSGHRRSR